MISIRLSAFALLFVALSLSISSAQEKSNSSNGEIAKIETSYDSAKDRTTVRFSQWPIAEMERERWLIDAEGSYPTHTPTNHGEDVLLKITVISSDGYKYEQSLNLMVTIGKVRFQPWLLKESDRKIVNTEYVQTLVTTVDFAEFFTIAQTNNVQMKMNDTQILLDVERLKKLLELGRLLIRT